MSLNQALRFLVLAELLVGVVDLAPREIEPDLIMFGNSAGRAALWADGLADLVPIPMRLRS
jgi:hypothetical protein